MSAKFESFPLANGVKCIMSSPYHPVINGLTDCTVQILQKGLKKVANSSLQIRLAQILMSYQIIPQSSTGASPAQLHGADSQEQGCICLTQTQNPLLKTETESCTQLKSNRKNV